MERNLEFDYYRFSNGEYYSPKEDLFIRKNNKGESLYLCERYQKIRNGILSKSQYYIVSAKFGCLLINESEVEKFDKGMNLYLTGKNFLHHKKFVRYISNPN